jgi:acyl-CoA thioesterase
MLFSEILDSMTLRDGAWSAIIPDEWRQGRTVFGGLQAALMLRALRTLVPADIPLRVLQTTFVAPTASEAVRVEARVLRSGKSAVHAKARLVDSDQTLSLVTAVFGSKRPSRVEVVPQQQPVHSESPAEFQFVTGRAPNFTKHFGMRWLLGGLPFSGNPLPRAVIEVSMNDTAKTSEEHVVAIADAIPPVALSMLDTYAPGSSLTWTLEIFRERLDELSLKAWRLDADLTAGRDGYTSQSVMVWGPGGEAVALSRQCMVVFG